MSFIPYHPRRSQAFKKQAEIEGRQDHFLERVRWILLLAPRVAVYTGMECCLLPLVTCSRWCKGVQQREKRSLDQAVSYGRPGITSQYSAKAWLHLPHGAQPAATHRGPGKAPPGEIPCGDKNNMLRIQQGLLLSEPPTTILTIPALFSEDLSFLQHCRLLFKSQHRCG